MNDPRKAAEARLREIGAALERLQAVFLAIRMRAKDGVLRAMKKGDDKKIGDIRKTLGLK